MGTRFRIVIHTQDEAAGRVAIGRAFQRAAELDQKLSDYKPGSELNRFCRSAFGTPVVVSDDLFQVVRRLWALAAKLVAHSTSLWVH